MNSLTPHYFDWVVKTMADYTIGLAKAGRAAPTEYAWGRMVASTAPGAMPVGEADAQGSPAAEAPAPKPKRATKKKAEA